MDRTQHVGQCSLLVDLGNRFFARVISRVAHQMHELIEPAPAIVHRLAGVVFQLRVVGVEKAADTRISNWLDWSSGYERDCAPGRLLAKERLFPRWVTFRRTRGEHI